jgi:hypothetical protein
MSKYEPLYDHLKPVRANELTMSFTEIEAVLGAPLPVSARQHKAWWANSSGKGHTQPTCWHNAGWKTANVNLVDENVTFIRRADVAKRKRTMFSPDAIPAETWSAAEALTGITDRDEIVRRAMRQLLASEAASRLIALGGTDKEAAAPDRRRILA